MKKSVETLNRLVMVLMTSIIMLGNYAHGQESWGPGIPNLPELQIGYKFVPEFEIKNDWLRHYVDSIVVPFAIKTNRTAPAYNIYFYGSNLSDGRPGEVCVTITIEKTDGIPRIDWAGYGQIGSYRCFADEFFIERFTQIGEKYIKMDYDGTPVRGYNDDNVEWNCFFVPDGKGGYEIATWAHRKRKTPKLSRDGRPQIGWRTRQERFWETGYNRIREDRPVE